MVDKKLLGCFAVVKLWPNLKAAEDEVIERLRIAARKIGVECVVIDKEGRRVDPPNTCITKNDVDFVIHLHFETPKTYDVFSFVTIWNPLQFYFDWGYRRFSINLLSHDDFLSCSSSWADDHVRRMTTQDPYRDTASFMNLYPSVAEPIHTPDLGRRKLIYCGINWERISRKEGRFHQLLKQLDQGGLLIIHGPDVFQGVRVWEGFNSYAGSIPFDGRAMVDAIHEAGISLVLSSEAHKESEQMSSRLFESIAAGAAVICDENPFGRRFFGDTLFYIDMSRSEEEVRDQILEHRRWIIENEAKTLRMIEDAQAIFKEKFALDRSLQRIFDEFPERKAHLKSIRQPGNSDTPVYMILLCTGDSVSEEVQKQVENFLSQDYGNCIPVFVLNERGYLKNRMDIDNSIANVGKGKENGKRIIFCRLKNKESNHAAGRIVAVGAALEPFFAGIPEGSCFCLVAPNERLFSDHISSLVRCLEDHSQSRFAISDSLLTQCKNQERLFDYDMRFDANAASAESSARFLFRKSAGMADLFPAFRYISYMIPQLLIGDSSGQTVPSTRRATVIQDIQDNFYSDRQKAYKFEVEICRDYSEGYREPSLEKTEREAGLVTLSHCSQEERFAILKDLIKSIPMPPFIFKPLRCFYRVMRKWIVIR